VAPDLFAGFDPERFPMSSLPALALGAAAYKSDLQHGERVNLALREALFEEGRDLTDPAVQAVARHLLLFIVVSQLADAVQCVLSFALRSYRVALLPALCYALGLWGVGLGGGALLAFRPPAGWPTALSGPAAFWFANGLALLAVAGLLWALLQRVSTEVPRVAATG